MIVLTLKERQTIDTAVYEFGRDYQIGIWKNWKQYHHENRNGPVDPVDDGAGRLPQNVVYIVIAALEEMKNSIRKQIDSPSTSEESAIDLCNDIAEINSISEVIRAA